MTNLEYIKSLSASDFADYTITLFDHPLFAYINYHKFLIGEDRNLESYLPNPKHIKFKDDVGNIKDGTFISNRKMLGAPYVMLYCEADDAIITIPASNIIED